MFDASGARVARSIRHSETVGTRAAPSLQALLDAANYALCNAQQRGGKLMTVEVALAMHLAEDTVRETMDAMVAEGRAELEVTDGGNLVYTFPTLAQLVDKSTARGILDD